MRLLIEQSQPGKAFLILQGASRISCVFIFLHLATQIERFTMFFLQDWRWVLWPSGWENVRWPTKDSLPENNARPHWSAFRPYHKAPQTLGRGKGEIYSSRRRLEGSAQHWDEAWRWNIGQETGLLTQKPSIPKQPVRTGKGGLLLHGKREDRVRDTSISTEEYAHSLVHATQWSSE